MNLKILSLIAFYCLSNANASADEHQYLFRIKEHDLFGFCDETGKTVVPLKYQWADKFNEGLAVVQDKNNKYGYIDAKGKESIPLKFDDGYSFSDGLALVGIGSRFAYINKSGKVVFYIPAGFSSLFGFSEGLACLGQGTNDDYHFGYMNKHGKLVIPKKFSLEIGRGETHPFSEGLAYILENGKPAYIDKSGRKVIELKFAGKNFSDGLAEVYISEMDCGYINKKGEIVFHGAFCALHPFSEDVACVAVERGPWIYGYVRKNGKWFIPPKFQSAQNFSEGLAAVEVNDRWGFIDHKGEWIIQPQFYDFVESFKNGLAIVAIEANKYAYINKQGKIVRVTEIEEGC